MEGIPTLVVVTKEGKLLTDEGDEQVDIFAERFIFRLIFVLGGNTHQCFSGDLTEAGRSSWCVEGDGRQILNVQNTQYQILTLFLTPVIVFIYLLLKKYHRHCHVSQVLTVR